ncbi:MAG: glycosyltransferase family 39 protein, partial [Anaerolineales bacterium]
AGSMALFGESFRAAQAPFVLIAAALPLLAARISFELTRDRELATQAGVLAAFSGFVLPFFVTTDAFALYAVLGAITFLLMTSALEKPTARAWLGVGILSGVGSLARADSLLLLATAVLALILAKQDRARGFGALLVGFVLVLAPWWARNLSVVGSLTNPGGARLLWMLSYDDLFSYPAEVLSFDRWRQAGLAGLLAARGSALMWNSARLVAENGLVFLGPFMLLGAFRLRSRPLVRLPISYLGLLFAVMTIGFPFIGPRGAFFHSSTAAMPVLWALAPVGLRAAIDWAGGKRKWEPGQARRVLGTAAVLLAAGVTIGLYVTRLVLPARDGQGWGSGSQSYLEVGQRIPDPVGRVAVNNPPGFSLATGREAVVIPNGPPETLRQVARRYQVDWIVLESNHPSELDGLYASPESLPWLRLAGTLTDPSGMPIYLFSVIQS